MREHRFPKIAGCIALAAVPICAVSAPVETPVQPPAVDPVALLLTLDAGFTAIFDRVAPAVVVIDATKAREDGAVDPARALEFFFRDPDAAPGGPIPDGSFETPMPEQSEGSGFLVRENGYIVTNNHVIEGAMKLGVRLKDGRTFPATVVGTDDRTDIAVLKIEATGLPAIEFADSEAVRIGQLVCSIGIPFSLDYSFSCGWVSGKGRNKLTDTTYEDYIQTDAFINPGNSGGPLLDVQGRVIGMNTLINGIGRGLAFAIPSNMLRDVSDQLIATGKIVRPWLGVRIATLDAISAERTKIEGVERGVIVETVVSGAPAAQTDLRKWDVITEVDSVPVPTDSSLQKEVLKKKIGQKVELTVWRGSAFVKVPIVTEEAPAKANLPRREKKSEKAEKKNERTPE